MTSEELIVLLDSLQTRIPKCANQVLLRLVAKCITNGTNEVDQSAGDLARELGISEDSVKVAKRALVGIVATAGGARVSTRWILPADWFVVQRSLFAVPSAVESVVNWPGNQGSLAWKPGQQLPQKPGQSALETRATGPVTRAAWTSFQGSAGLETRADDSQQLESNQPVALETRALSIDRDRVLSSTDHSVSLRDSIEGVNFLPQHFRPDGEQLKKWLRFYFAQSRPHTPIPDGPDEIILAKCVAIAPLARLRSVLQNLAKKKTTPGDNWAWWVTVFCQRVHSTKDTTAVPAPAGFHQPKKPASSEGGGQFPADLLQEVAAAARTM